MKYEANSKSSIEESMNVFGFLEVVSSFFPSYKFIPYKADSFVQEVLKSGKITSDEFKQIINDEIEEIKKYSDFQLNEKGFQLNPYTLIRHALYLNNKSRFKTQLYDVQRKNIEKWINDVGQDNNLR